MGTVLLIGKTGQVGFELERALAPLGQLIAPGRAELDLTDPDSIRNCLMAAKADVIVNAAGFTIVDDAEAQPDLTMQLNATAPGIIAESAKKTGALLVHYSTTFVFDGAKHTPYTEDDAPNPLNAYGHTKLAGESAIMASGGNYIILRANWVFSARRRNFALAILKAARKNSELKMVADQIGSPTWARDYADVTAGLLKQPKPLQDNTGIYHLSAQSQCSRMTWAQKLIDSARAVSGIHYGWATLRPTTTAQYPLPALRPLYTVTNNQKFEATFGIRMPVWEDRIEPFVRTLQWN